MKFNKGLLLTVAGVATLFASLNSYAYFCSTPQGKSGYINVGDTMAKVESSCGKPTSTEDREDQQQNLVTTQYFVYQNLDLQESIPLSVGGKSLNRNVSKTAPLLVFEVRDGQVQYITSNSKSVSKTSDCQYGSVSVGDSVEKLVQNCGQASQINTENKKEEGDARKVTVWKYDLGQYRSPLILEFEAGKLSNIQTR